LQFAELLTYFDSSTTNNNTMNYWTSPDGIQGTAREFITIEMNRCECGCRERFPADEIFRHPVTGENIALRHEDEYNTIIESERIENE